ncbi:uncharacterized protein LOC141816265, partial [Curcuma longa]|uniref:uncharacterized protein LOC141816265 n=1 Tax=Curcuma longa TaxID=136217 RepID=UPI003D9F485F
MAMKEGFSTNRPPFFDGADFQYWRSRMEYYLKTDISMWFSVKEGFTPPRDEEGKELDSSRWSMEQTRKGQADAKAVVTLQCGINKDQLIKVGPFTSAKDLWNKLIELHEGTRDSRIAKRDLFLNQLQNLSMKENETVSELHGRFKEILNGLHTVDEKVENRDLVRYVLKSFPRNALWSSMVDAYKVSKDLSIVKLDEFFCEMELHELANKGQKEKEQLKTSKIDEIDDLHVELLEDENKALKSEVEKLKSLLGKFSTSSKTLDMILNAQRAVYNKAGI